MPLGIPKENKTSHDPPAYRVLLIMSSVEKKWATMRLKHVAPWTHRIARPQMYAGVLGQGAEQAWWHLSLCLEFGRSRQTQATRGATDTYKCFVQIVRPVIYMTAKVAGIPKRVFTQSKAIPRVFADDHCDINLKAIRGRIAASRATRT